MPSAPLGTSIGALDRDFELARRKTQCRHRQHRGAGRAPHGEGAGGKRDTSAEEICRCGVPSLVADGDRNRTIGFEMFAEPHQGSLRLMLLGHEPFAEIAIFDPPAHRVEIADAEARRREAVNRAAEVTDREAEAPPRDLGDQVVEAEIAGPEDDSLTLVQSRLYLFAAKDVDCRLPAAGAPGAQILEALLVAIGPILDGDAARVDRWRHASKNCRDVRCLIARSLGMRRRVDLTEEPGQRPPRQFRKAPGEHSLHRQARHFVDILGGDERPRRRCNRSLFVRPCNRRCVGVFSHKRLTDFVFLRSSRHLQDQLSLALP